MRKYASRALAVLFLGFLLLMFGGTMIKYGRNYAYGVFKGYIAYVPRSNTLYDKVRARVITLEKNSNERILLRSFMRQFNTGYQEALGKDMIAIASHYTTRLKCGALYDLMTTAYDYEKVDDLISLSESLKEQGIPSLMVYCHGGLYERDQLSEGYMQIDNNDECADDYIARMRANGLPVTDSRDAYNEAGLTMEQAILKSDIHWAHRMALETADKAVADMNANFETAFDEDALNYERFEEVLYPSLLLGELGSRFGAEYTQLDDIRLLYPKYDTNIYYEANYNGHIEREGTFYEAIIYPEKLELDIDTGFNNAAYYVYGDYLAQTHTINESAPEGRVLVFKDSFGTPVSTFLSLACREVFAVELRSSKLTMQEWVDRIQPDYVVYAYSQQMLRGLVAVIAS